MRLRIGKRMKRRIAALSASLAQRLGYDVVPYYGPPARVAACRIVHASVNGVAVSFFVMHEQDHIQRHHLEGRFHEEEELQMIGRRFAPGGVFVDVGANVGNHALYAAKVLRAGKVIAVEPNPTAYRVLKVNAALNDLDGRLAHHPVGLSDVAAQGTLRNGAHEANLGGASIERDAAGAVPLVRGDDLLAGERVDFLKIDVEGMELAALRGLEGTLARERPGLFVEVDDANRAAFDVWLGAQGYRVAERFRRYASNENILALPIERGS